MPNIHILDQSTINQIAAGEVVERPSSVVKELMENAIDARATAITVEIRDGGISFIRITDNGCGIPKEEIPLAFLRHSTSKIQSVEDLITVSSLGFRGEALSSIAAVTQVEVITKTPESLTGTRYQIEGGVEKSIEEIGAPEGTTFIVRNLFYNTPVRRKFLKTAMTEAAHVADLVEKIALSHPEISIRFIQNNQNKLHTSGNHNLKDIIYTIYGRETAANLLPVQSVGESVVIEGFIGKPVIARSNRNFEIYFINGRYIKSGVVCKAIEEAYKPFMMQHKYPFTMLNFRMEPEYLDVNVHPTKMELRFRNGEMVFTAIRDTLLAALREKELIPEVELTADGDAEGKREVPDSGKSGIHEKRIPIPEPFEKRRMELLREEQGAYGRGMAGTAVPGGIGREQSEIRNLRSEQSVPGFLPESLRSGQSEGAAKLRSDQRAEAPVSDAAPEAAQSGKIQETELRQEFRPEPQLESKPTQMDLFEEKFLEPKARLKHRLIGQLFDTYWLVEFNDQLYIIDQHAAHEKVLHEKTMAALKTRQHTSQMLNPPIVLTLGSSEEVVLKKYMKYFVDIGFEIEHFGGREYTVRGVPDNLFSIAQKELLMEMLDGLSEDTLPESTADMVYAKVASMSCKAAVKGRHQMSFAEADQLIDQLLDLENPYACPHGRPTIISMSRYELEKKFKRIV